MTKLELENFHPGLSVDCVIFGFHQNELRVLLLKVKNIDKWALPGGFVGKEEDVDKAAVHVLKQRTGLSNIFLSQFHLFGDMARNEPGYASWLMEKGVIGKDLFDWFEQRFITVGYYALVEYSRVKKPKSDYISESCEWCALNELPEMLLDHRKIITKAYETLKIHLNYLPIGVNLLPDRFTMPELQALYETLLGKKLDRRNFQRKMLSYDILIRTDERRMGGAHKAPWLYEFDEKKYHRALQDGLNSGW